MPTIANATDLWPSILDLTEEETPLSVLKAQAEALSDRTRHAVSGWVITTVVEGGKKYNQEFSVIAPVLGAQARVPILTLKHLVAASFPIDCDALTLTDPFHDSKRVSTMDELKDWLRLQLASDRTMKVVSRLYSQVSG